MTSRRVTHPTLPLRWTAMLWSLLATVPFVLGACESCDTHPATTCSTSQSVLTAGIPTRLGRLCDPYVQWDGFNGRSWLGFTPYCGSGTSGYYKVDVTLPRVASPTTFTLPSPQVPIDATLIDATGEKTPVEVTSGSITINHLSASDLDADVDIQGVSTADEAFSITGHVGVSDCTFAEVRNCD
jgi:hypothetical protein